MPLNLEYLKQQAQNLSTQDLKDLVAAVKHSPEGTQMLQPHVGVSGQKALPGNPVMLSHRAMTDLLQSAQKLESEGSVDRSSLPGGKEWRQRNPEHVHPRLTSNVHYRIDMDTPEDMAKLEAQYGIQLVWDEGL